MDLLHLTVTGIIPETRDAVSIRLEPERGEINYQAGQFLTLIFPQRGAEIRRSYSFSSTPGIDPFCSITVKRIANGEVSRLLSNHLSAGDSLISLPPAGRFLLETDPELNRQIFFLAAGSGIVPVFSLLKKLLASEPLSRAVLVYQNHTEASTLFYDALLALEQKSGDRLTWINLLTHPGSGNLPAGRLHPEYLRELVKSLSQSGQKFFLCGPQVWMRMVLFTLKAMGYRDEDIRKENFTIDPVPPSTWSGDLEPKEIQLLREGQRYSYRISYPKTILEGAMDNQIPLPYSCRAGRCSTCIARLLKGRITMSVNEVLTDRDLREGLVLTCVAYPLTDVELAT
jgi:ring-1,2-phenylacetyl-CoA epoxidase subunit PaaE